MSIVRDVEQYLENRLRRGVLQCGDCVVEWETVGDQWFDADVAGVQGGDGIGKRTAAGADDANLVDNDRRQRESLLAGDGRLENDRAPRANELERRWQSGGRSAGVIQLSPEGAGQLTSGVD